MIFADHLAQVRIHSCAIETDDHQLTKFLVQGERVGFEQRK